MDNLKIAEQLKKLQEDMNSLVEAQTRQLQSQARVVEQIADAYSKLNPSDTIQNIEATKNALDQAAASAQKTGESTSNMQKLSEAIASSALAQTKLGVTTGKTLKVMGGFASITGMWKGFSAGLKGTYNVMKLMSSMTGSVAEGLGQLAISVISFPFKILSGLIDFASKGGGDSGLRQALEDIRKEFGNLKQSSASTIISMSRSMKGELSNTGLSVYRIFGNLAERLKTIAEYAKNVGPLFAVLAGQFDANAEAIGAYFKGLGLTEEGQKAIASRAYALGEDLTEVTRQLANYSVQMAADFGLSAKEVSRDVGTMMSDFENFGGMAPQVLTQISVYARRLGVDVKGLVGTINQFDNFEGAARSAAQLTQAFGLQLDALELLKEQDPAARTEMMRKAFFAAGRSIEGMTRQERALLQQQTGLEVSSLNLVFSAKNQALSYDQVKKKSEGARKSQLTQEESMQKLAGAIDRLVKSGSAGEGGFFERFFQGFERGITKSSEFREIMINIKGALRATYRAGIEVGQMFVDMFPGVQNLLKGVAGLFDPTRFRKMLSELKTHFKSFFKSLTGGNGAESVKTFIENLKTMFFDYFNGSSEQGRRILSGARDFLKTFAQIAAGVLRMALDGITKGIRFVVDLLKGGNLSSLGIDPNGFLGFVMSLIQPLADAIVDAWPALKQAFIDLFDQVWPRVRDFLSEHALVISAVLFGPALLRGLFSGLIAPFATGLATGLIKAFADRSVKKAVTAGMQSLAATVTPADAVKDASAIKGATETVSATGGMAKAAQSATISGSTIARMALIGLIIAVGVMAIMAAIVGLAHYIKSNQLSTEQLLGASAVFAVAGLVMIELAAAVVVVSQAGSLIQANMTGAAAGIAAVGVVGGLMTLGIIAIVDAFKDIDSSKLNTAILAMTAGGAFILAASGVLMAATAIGALFVATYGVGAALAVAGLAAIAATTELMVEQVKNVITEVNRLQVSGNLQTKLDIFTQVLGAITTFGTMVADIANATSHSSLMGWITGSGARNQIEVLGKLRETVKGMTEHMKTLVRDTLRAVMELSIAPETLQKAELFGRIMSTIGEMVKNLQPPESLFQAEGLFTTGIDERLSSLGEFITRLTTSLKGVIQTVATQFAEIARGANFGANARENFAAIGEMLGIVGSLGRSLLIVINQQYSGLNGDELRARLPDVTEVMVSMMQTMFSGGLMDSLRNLVQGFISALSGLSTRDTNRLRDFAPLLTSAFQAIAQIGLTVGTLGALVENIPPEARGQALGTINAIVGSMLGGIRNIVVSMIKSTKDMFSGLSTAQVAAIKGGVETMKGMFDVLAVLPGTLTDLATSLGGGNFRYDTIRERLGTIVSLFERRDSGGQPGLPVLFEAAAKAFNGLPAITGDPSANIDILVRSLNSITAMSAINFDQIAMSVQTNSEVLRSGAFTHMADNIKAMVTEINSIATELGSLEAIEINTQLKALGGKLGLGQSEELTIRNQNFNITVELDVHIDARELENVMVDRPNTRVMSRPKS